MRTRTSSSSLLRLLAGAGALIVLTSCNGSPSPAECETPSGSMECARELAVADPVARWPTGGEPKPVIIYIDRSGSIRGYLDPSYSARTATDYRSVIDGLIMSLRPTSAFGFGTSLRTSPVTLDALWDREFYNDSNTLMEQVIDRVVADTAAASTHLILGDGRRGSARSSHLQFSRMRQAADEWIDAGGTFMVAATMAPFRPMPDDPAGCSDGSVDCPLYVFAYVAPGEVPRVSSTLADVFEHLYVWPLPGMPASALTVAPGQATSGISLNRAWQRSPEKEPIIRVTGTQPGATLQGTVQVADTTEGGRTLNAVLQGQLLSTRIDVKPLNRDAGLDWQRAPGASALVQASNELPLGLQISTAGQQQASLYKVELLPTGNPSWQNQFSAEGAGDPRRTLGLDILFEAFRRDAARLNQPVARLYIVAN